GLGEATIRARQVEELETEAEQERAERRAKPTEDKERVRWVQGYRAACRVAEAATATQIISLADSEGDVYESILEAQAGAGVRKASFIIRACQNRAVVLPDAADSAAADRPDAADSAAAEVIRRLREQV